MELTNFQLWKNEKKEPGSKQPDYRITAKIGEKFSEIGAGWKKQDTKGNTYLSCTVKEPQEKPKKPDYPQESNEVVF